MLSPLPLVLALLPQQSIPTVNVTPIVLNEILLINREDILERNTQINLDWIATHQGTFNYEITYDRRTTEGDQAPLVLFDSDRMDAVNQNTGTSRSGVMNRIVMRPSQIAAFVPGVTLTSTTTTIGEFTNIAAFNNTERLIVINIFPSGDATDDMRSAQANFTFTVDTVRPPPPTLNEVVRGEDRLTLRFTPAIEVDGEQIDFHRVVYCVATSSVALVDENGQPIPEEDVQETARAVFVDSTGFDPDAGPFEVGDLPCDEVNAPVQSSGTISDTLTEFAIEDGLVNGFPTLIGIRSVDSLENEGQISNVAFGVPREVDDFFERFNRDGVLEEGGFCFVATAAYGAYGHPMVRILRGFRDEVLAAHPLGRAFIQTYYVEGPAWAEWLRATPGGRVGAQFGLSFLTFGAVISSYALPLFALLIVLLGLGRRWRFGGTGLLLLMALGMGASTAHAIERPKATLPIGVGLEFKVGPFQPALATDTSNSAFVDIFRDGGVTNPLFVFGSELQLLRTKFGTFGTYGSIGFVRWQGNALTPGVEPPQQENDTTALNLIPLTDQLFYRADFIVDRTPIPLVPYLRGGLAYDLYWTTDGSGDISEVQEGGETFRGLGGKFGFTGTVGLMLYLNFIDPNAARDLYNTTRIRGTYIFGELIYSQVDGFGQRGFDFSDGTWNLGLYLEL
ncbi:MAG: MXAN_2562 family outer membrane beta-barrel protein [Myxococcota bacterium]